MNNYTAYTTFPVKLEIADAAEHITRSGSSKMKETKHDYGNCIVGNFYDKDCTAVFGSWEEFKSKFAGFNSQGYDDTYHFVFRYDVCKTDEGTYCLELCVMLQRKGIYLHLYVQNIHQAQLDSEIEPWLKERFSYIKDLWVEVKD